MTLIETYVRDLARASGGRRSVIVTEARDHLYDAAEAWEERGLDRAEAEQRAVEEFGSVEQLAPGFRSVTALATARRTAVVLLLVVGVQPLVWLSHTQSGSGQSATLDRAAWTIAGLSLSLSVASLLVCSLGVRWWGVRSWMTVAVSGWAAVVAVSAGLVAALWMPVAGGTWSGLVLAVVALEVPMAYVVTLAVRSWRQLGGRVAD